MNSATVNTPNSDLRLNYFDVVPGTSDHFSENMPSTQSLSVPKNNACKMRKGLDNVSYPTDNMHSFIPLSSLLHSNPSPTVEALNVHNQMPSRVPNQYNLCDSTDGFYSHTTTDNHGSNHESSSASSENADNYTEFDSFLKSSNTKGLHFFSCNSNILNFF